MDSSLAPILGFLGVIIGTLIAQGGARAALKEQRRKTRQDYLISRMDILSDSLAQYEVWLSKWPDPKNYPSEGSVEAADHAHIVGRAIAACLAVGDLPEKDDKLYTKIDGELPDVPYYITGQIYQMHRLAYIANKRLTRNFVNRNTAGIPQQKEVDLWGEFNNRNRAALDHAIKRLAQIIAQNQNIDDEYAGPSDERRW